MICQLFVNREKIMDNIALLNKLINFKPHQKLYVESFRHNPEIHPTNHLYEILDVAINGDNEEDKYVVYRSLKNPVYIKNKTFVRNINDFCSIITVPNDNTKWLDLEFRYNEVPVTYVNEQCDKLNKLGV